MNAHKLLIVAIPHIHGQMPQSVIGRGERDPVPESRVSPNFVVKQLVIMRIDPERLRPILLNFFFLYACVLHVLAVAIFPFK